MLPNVLPCTLILGNYSQREVENCDNALKFFKGKMPRRIRLSKWLLKFYVLLISGWTELVFDFYFVSAVVRFLKRKNELVTWITIHTTQPIAFLLLLFKCPEGTCLIHHYCFLISFTLFSLHRMTSLIVQIYFWIHVYKINTYIFNPIENHIHVLFYLWDGSLVIIATLVCAYIHTHI